MTPQVQFRVDAAARETLERDLTWINASLLRQLYYAKLRVLMADRPATATKAPTPAADGRAAGSAQGPIQGDGSDKTSLSQPSFGLLFDPTDTDMGALANSALGTLGGAPGGDPNSTSAAATASGRLAMQEERVYHGRAKAMEGIRKGKAGFASFRHGRQQDMRAHDLGPGTSGFVDNEAVELYCKLQGANQMVKLLQGRPVDQGTCCVM